jgi:hypothetical protein
MLRELCERAVDLDPVPLLPPGGHAQRAQLVADAEEDLDTAVELERLRVGGNRHAASLEP